MKTITEPKDKVPVPDRTSPTALSAIEERGMDLARKFATISRAVAVAYFDTIRQANYVEIMRGEKCIATFKLSMVEDHIKG